jgi:hypothetical protein
LLDTYLSFNHLMLQHIFDLISYKNKSKRDQARLNVYMVQNLDYNNHLTPKSFLLIESTTIL